MSRGRGESKGREQRAERGRRWGGRSQQRELAEVTLRVTNTNSPTAWMEVVWSAADQVVLTPTDAWRDAEERVSESSTVPPLLLTLFFTEIGNSS